MRWRGSCELWVLEGMRERSRGRGKWYL